jgi:GntR family transcriptional regulator/MocR family aminotransferase
VTLTTTAPLCGLTGPGIHGVSSGTANAAEGVMVGRIHPAWTYDWLVSGSNSDISEQTNSVVPGFPDILLALDRSGRRGLREQLQQQLRLAIQQGRLPAAALLPPSRTLARELGVARSVVVDAYEQLAADGYLGTRRGSGTRVLPTTKAVATDPTVHAEPAPAVRLIGGLPDPALFPRAEWLRHYRWALNTLPNQQLGYSGPLGALPLREALSGYITRVRGAAVRPDRVLITAGLTQAIVLLCRALRSRGAEAIAVEDPGFGFHREAIANIGLRVVPVPVDDDGLDIVRLAEHKVAAVVVAPAHSYPTGAVLCPARRTALIEWAQDNDVLVIEDDYDAEFRYDRAPIGALQGLAPEQVAYAGCVSKTLTPALRLGWIALPGRLVKDVVRQKLLDDMGTTLLEQLTLARFIETGGLTRHLRRVRGTYRRRLDAALEAVATSLPDAVPKRVAAGLHLYVQLPTWCDELRLVESAYKRGLVIEGASWHWSVSHSAPPALVLGYGAVDEPAIRRGLEVLASIYQEQRTSRNPNRRNKHPAT